METSIIAEDPTGTKLRLEQIRVELNAERISQDALVELSSYANEGLIDPSDVQLLEAAGVPEGEYDPMGGCNKFTHTVLPVEVASAEPAVQLEFYKAAFISLLNGALSVPQVGNEATGETYIPVQEDDSWWSWLSPNKQPLPQDAPNSLQLQHPDGWEPGFDVNWMTKNGDWGDGNGNWADHCEGRYDGYDLWICASTLEWYKYNSDNEWTMQNQCDTIVEAKARLGADGQWEVEMITTAEELS